MSDDNDEWVNLAMTDTSLVADLLLRMRSSTTTTTFSPPLKWTVRQRRSKYVTKKVTGVGGAGFARASPSTPLSWSSSGGGGGRGAGELYEEESKVKLMELVNARSKVPITCETTPTTTTKKSRKKKTLAELKEEESLLLKERRQLKIELAIIQITVEKQRATNERLKRMKLDLPPQQSGQWVAFSKVVAKAGLDQTQQTNSVCGPSTVLHTSVACNVTGDVPQTSQACAPSRVQDIGNNDTAFLLPDLNMPAGEDASCHFLK